MNSLYVFDLGGTKSSVAYGVKSAEKIMPQLATFDGFNPNRCEGDFFVQVKNALKIDGSDRVVIYGSGLSTDENKNKVTAKFNTIFNVQPTVYTDLVGAAHALWKDEKGLIAIMGTGGCAAYYNGTTIEERRGGYGYLIDDLGGGLELGRFIVSNWLNGELPLALAEALFAHFEIPPTKFTTHFYKNVDLSQLASVSKITADFQTYYEVKALLLDYFNLFFIRNIKNLAQKTGIAELGIVGSVGKSFENIIITAAEQNSIHAVKIIKHPIKELFAYHCKKQKRY